MFYGRLQTLTHKTPSAITFVWQITRWSLHAFLLESFAGAIYIPPVYRKGAEVSVSQSNCIKSM